ncbi:MAG: hypothetical protein IPM23_11890 [Candidatus Melainabacteria bacterium]|nr:hypothetical protein [Candidatus Melainabacteria bacterium]
MIRNLFSLALLLSMALPAFAGESAEAVHAISLDGGKPAVVTGNISSGKKIPLDWAARSSVACFPGTRFEMFDGNHVFYRVELPARSQMKIRLVPKDRSRVINLYALRQGAGGEQPVPPDVDSAISAEASYPLYAKTGTRTIRNSDDGTRKIDFISVDKPYSILIGVAGGKGSVEGEYELSVAVDRR